MKATHVDTLSIQDHLRAGRTAIAAQMCEDVALAEYDLPPGTRLPVPLEWAHRVPSVSHREVTKTYTLTTVEAVPVAAKKWWQR